MLNKKEQNMETLILYVGVGVHRDDDHDVITVGTTRLDLINCRSNQKTMQIVHVFTLSRTDVSKGQFEYWENQKLSKQISTIIEPTRVIYDTLSMNGKCQGRTNNWWKLNDTKLEEVILYVKEKFEAYDKGTTDTENKED